MAKEHERKLATRKCDMCHKPLTSSKTFKVVPLLRPDLTLTVGPDCYRKEKKARAQMLLRHTTAQLEALRAKATP